MPGIYIDAFDLRKLTGKSLRTCYRQMSSIKDALSKKKTNKITITEYAKFEGIEVQEIEHALNNHSPVSK